MVDVDAHLPGPVDWLEQVDPQLAGILGEPLRFIDIADGIFGISNSGVARLPEQQQPASRR